MKIYPTLAVFVISGSFAFGAMAHEHGLPKQDHEMAKYDCEAVHKMDHSKMDMDQSDMQDMMKACGGHEHDGHDEDQHHHQDNQEESQHHGEHDDQGTSCHHN